MPQTVIFLEDLHPGEKGIAEMLAPVSIRRLTLCFSIVSITWGSSVFMVVIGTWMGGLRTPQSVGGLASIPLGTEDNMPSSDFPDKWGRVPEVASSGGTPS
jgi:hypothetical protein